MQPSAREWQVLQSLGAGAAENLGAMPGIGMGTISEMVDEGWIEELPGTPVDDRPRWHLKPEGGTIRAQGRAKKKRGPPRLKALPPSIGEAPARIRPAPRGR